MDNKPTKGQYVDVLLRSPKTIFSVKDVSLLWGEEAGNAIRVRLNNYVRTGKLIRVRRGIYAKDNNYNRLELATRIYTPSYVSFETILTGAGINFQVYSNIFVASYVTRDIEADKPTSAKASTSAKAAADKSADKPASAEASASAKAAADKQKISFIRMKDYVLTNTIGIEHADGIAMATKERAFLDRIYVSKDYHFDNLNALDWDKVFNILPVYNNKRMEKKVKQYFNHYKSDQSTKPEKI